MHTAARRVRSDVRARTDFRRITMVDKADRASMSTSSSLTPNSALSYCP